MSHYKHGTLVNSAFHWCNAKLYIKLCPGPETVHFRNTEDEWKEL